MNRIKILTIRPNNEEEKDLIRYVMEQSGCKTASQAMLFACKAYRINNERREEMKKMEGENPSKQEIMRLKKVISELNRKNNELARNLNNRIREEQMKQQEMQKKKMKNLRKIQKTILELQMQVENY